jgi:hypothetical protein
MGHFQTYIPKTHKSFGIKIYKLYDSKGYTYNMSLYLGRDRKCAAATVNTAHTTVLGLTARNENLGHKLYIDSFFSCHDLLYDIHMKALNYCGTVRPNQKGMPSDLGRKLGLKQCDIKKTRVKGSLTAVV